MRKKLKLNTGRKQSPERLNVSCFSGRISTGISCGYHTFSTTDFIIRQRVINQLYRKSTKQIPFRRIEK